MAALGTAVWSVNVFAGLMPHLEDDASATVQRLLHAHPLLHGGGACPQAPPVRVARVLRRHPHDPQSFVQGLVFSNGTLYESSGLYGKSSVRIVHLLEGRVVRANYLNTSQPVLLKSGQYTRRAPRAYFGEGLAYWGGRLFQLTWREESVLVYNPSSLELIDEHPAFGAQLRRREGWGLTQDKSFLYTSDGSDHVYVVSPSSLRVLDTLEIKGMLPSAKAHRSVAPFPQRSIHRINDLELLPNGLLLFNVWFSDYIGVYDLRRGCLHSWIDARALNVYRHRRREGACLNGIAYDQVSGKLYVTGKLWPAMYDIALDGPPTR